MERHTERILLLVTPTQRKEITERAEAARLSLAEYLRRKVLDQAIDAPSSYGDRLDQIENRVDAVEKELARAAAGQAEQSDRKSRG